jgi:hypothetical protein
MTHESIAYKRAASAATELIAAVELITFGFQRRMQFDYVSLVDVLLPLTPEQHEKLVSFVISAGLDVNIFVGLVRGGMDTQLYFDAVERGAHPSLPTAIFMQFVQSMQPPVAQQVLSDRSAMQKAMVQLKVADQVTAMLRRFVPNAQEEESDNLANAS